MHYNQLVRLPCLFPIQPTALCSLTAASSASDTLLTPHNRSSSCCRMAPTSTTRCATILRRALEEQVRVLSTLDCLKAADTLHSYSHLASQLFWGLSEFINSA